MKRLTQFLAATVVTTLASVASATPRPLPFTYTYDTLGEGELEIEQYVDYTPIKVADGNSGLPTWYGATQLQTEFEYGITNRLELGLYVTFVPNVGDSVGQVPTSSFLEGNGIKQRLRLRLAEAGEWPLDVALYGEVTENDHLIELEGKIILERRIQKLRVAANLWAEEEFYFTGARDTDLNPTLGATYEVTPLFHPGAEAWMHIEYPDSDPHPRPFNLGPLVYVGPTMLFNFGKFWVSAGGYLRVTDFDRHPQIGDAFGNLWFRTVIGIEM